MTSEMQLAHAAGLAPVGHETALTFPQGLGHPTPPKPMGMRKIHRLLRGRYPMVITLGILCGIAFAVAGWILPKPVYSSHGNLEVNGTIPNTQGTVDITLPQFSAFLQSQVVEIQSKEMVERAMNEPDWQAISSSHTDDDIERFYENLLAEALPATDLIQITYSDPNPIIAQAGAKAMCAAYQEYFHNTDPMQFTKKLNAMRQEMQSHQNNLESNKLSLQDLSKNYGTYDLTIQQAAEQNKLATLDSKIQDMQSNIKYMMALQQIKTADAKDGAGKQELTDQQISDLGDRTIERFLIQRDDMDNRISMAKASGLGDNHPQVKELKAERDTLQQKIQSYVDNYNKNFQITAPTGKVGDTPAAFNIEQQLRATQAQLTDLQGQRDAQDLKVRQLNQNAMLLKDTQQNIEDEKGKLDVVTRNYNEMQAQQQLMQGQVQLVTAPAAALTPSSDPRKKLSPLGFLFGLCLPAGLVVLFGLLDTRLRFSDETNSDLGGVPLLGILPNLPDLLTDPAQAATAAHCVHQIRTILQITGHSMDRRVFTVTSSSSGDGKTSLTLALGLSFSASGSRTLLIDGDLVGGGLTARLNVKVDHGVLEAMASRDVMQYVRGTDVVDLSILPIGQALGGYTGTIAPAAVRRLVDEARKNFDVIIIDTGPILGSIEASPVAVAADGVILCVSRGQQRQTVDRALAHLHNIGAKLAGVVFNRAQSTDMERSMSRMSMKPLPSGDGRGSNGADRIGPVAKAVASSVRGGSNGSHG